MLGDRNGSAMIKSSLLAICSDFCIWEVFFEMRKLMVVVWIFITLMLLNSCKLGETMIIKDNDHQKAQDLIEAVLEAMQEKDDSKLKSLFSQTSLECLQSFDESASKLFDYFTGSVELFDDGAGPYVETTKEGNVVVQLMELSFNVKTEICEYRFAMQCITQGNIEDVGITSLYVIRTIDDENLDYMYWGDGKFTPGIHIGIHNVV